MILDNKDLRYTERRINSRTWEISRLRNVHNKKEVVKRPTKWRDLWEDIWEKWKVFRCCRFATFLERDLENLDIKNMKNMKWDTFVDCFNTLVPCWYLELTWIQNYIDFPLSLTTAIIVVDFFCSAQRINLFCVILIVVSFFTNNLLQCVIHSLRSPCNQSASIRKQPIVTFSTGRYISQWELRSD